MRKKIIVLFIILTMIIASIMLIYSKNIDEVVNTYANTYVSNLITKMLHETIDRYINEKGLDYFDIVTLDKDKNGDIKALTVNSGLLNKIRSETTILLAEEIELVQNKEFFIPLGNVLSSKILSGIGPKVKIKIIPLGYVSSEMKNDFYSVGINQSKHNISIKYNFSLNVVAPFSKASTMHTSSITIAESIIIGDVPNTNITVGSGFSETIKYYVN